MDSHGLQKREQCNIIRRACFHACKWSCPVHVNTVAYGPLNDVCWYFVVHRAVGFASSIEFNLFNLSFGVYHRTILLFYTISARPSKQPRMVRTLYQVQAVYTRSRGLGWRIHCGVEVTESSTNKLISAFVCSHSHCLPLDSALCLHDCCKCL